MRTGPHGTLAAAAAVALLATAGCGSDGPMDPQQTVASIDITSPIGTTLAVTGTAHLVAQALDQRGNPVTGGQFNWASSNPDVAGVDASGLVTAKAAGTVEITASTGSLTGRQSFDVVDADLDAVGRLGTDTFATALKAALAMAKRTTVDAAWEACPAGAESGNVDSVIACIDQLRAEAASASDPTDRALLGVLLLYADAMHRRLSL